MLCTLGAAVGPGLEQHRQGLFVVAQMLLGNAHVPEIVLSLSTKSRCYCCFKITGWATLGPCPVLDVQQPAGRLGSTPGPSHGRASLQTCAQSKHLHDTLAAWRHVVHSSQVVESCLGTETFTAYGDHLAASIAAPKLRVSARDVVAFASPPLLEELLPEGKH